MPQNCNLECLKNIDKMKGGKLLNNWSNIKIIVIQINLCVEFGDCLSNTLDAVPYSLPQDFWYIPDVMY